MVCNEKRRSDSAEITLYSRNCKLIRKTSSNLAVGVAMRSRGAVKSDDESGLMGELMDGGPSSDSCPFGNRAFDTALYRMELMRRALRMQAGIRLLRRVTSSAVMSLASERRSAPRARCAGIPMAVSTCEVRLSRWNRQNRLPPRRLPGRAGPRGARRHVVAGEGCDRGETAD